MVVARPLLASRGQASVGEEQIWRGMVGWQPVGSGRVDLGRQSVQAVCGSCGASGGARRPSRLRGKQWWLVVVVIAVTGSRRLVVVGRWWPDPLFSISGSLPVATLRWNRVLPIVARQIW
jgi:hypothetical protein